MANGKGRQGQHRPERENAKGKELVQAKQLIKQLRRQVARQEKTIRKLEEARGTPVELEELSPDPVGPQPTKEAERKCGCGSVNFTEFTTPGGKKLLSCRVCKTRL